MKTKTMSRKRMTYTHTKTKHLFQAFLFTKRWSFNNHPQGCSIANSSFFHISFPVRLTETEIGISAMISFSHHFNWLWLCKQSPRDLQFQFFFCFFVGHWLVLQFKISNLCISKIPWLHNKGAHRTVKSYWLTSDHEMYEMLHDLTYV